MSTTSPSDRRAARVQQIKAAWETLAAIDDPVARLVLDLHAPAWTDVDERELPECQGCEANGYEVDMLPWPCQTTVAVAAHFGIDVAPLRGYP